MPCRCYHRDCSKSATHGVDDGRKKKREYCTQHAKPGMVNVNSERCAQQGCTTRPSYGVNDGSRKPEYCSQHAKAGMVNVRSKRCAHQGCTKQPSYGVNDGSRKSEYCSQHAKAGMVDVRSKRCAHQGCPKQPSYGVDDGSKKVEYCAQHAKPRMVNVKNKRCAHQGCTKHPSYGVDDGSENPEYCSRHAKAGMVNVKWKKCGHQGCTKYQACRSPGSTYPPSCLQHDKERRDHAQGGKKSSSQSGARARRTCGDTVDDFKACQPRAASKRKNPVPLAASPGASFSNGDGARSTKRAHLIRGSPAAPGVLVKAEGADRLDKGQGSSSRSGRPRQGEGIQLRPTPPTRRQRVGRDPEVKTEVST